MSGTYVDISGLLQIEQNYLNNSPALKSRTASEATSSQIDNLKTQISSLQTSVSNVSEPVLIHQKDMSDILYNETTRLNSKKDSIDNAVSTQKRMIQMNDSDGKKNSEYIKMVVAGVIVLAIIIGLTFLSRIFPFIGGIVMFIVMLLISGYIIYCVQKYYMISSRDKMDFDKLATTSPNILTSTQTEATLKANQGSGDLLGSLNLSGCIGSSCCDVGTIWDISGQLCKPVIAHAAATAPPAGAHAFTTLSTAYKKGDMSYMSSSILPYERSEFDKYEKYNKNEMTRMVDG